MPSSLVDSPEYDAFCKGRLGEPYALYDRLRAEDPVHWSEVAKCWILSGYNDVARVLQYNPRMTADRLTVLLGRLPPAVREQLTPLSTHLSGMVQYYDPPEHSRLRSTAGK